MPTRRDVLSSGAHACTAALAAVALPLHLPTPADLQRFMLIGLTGPENPTRASLLVAWANALGEAGHNVRIELAGEATLLMRAQVADSLLGVGVPPFRTMLAKVQEQGIPIYVCRPCATARGVSEADLAGNKAVFTNAQAMAAAMAWATKVLVV
jgi:predicted peroxiredoxin